RDDEPLQNVDCCPAASDLEVSQGGKLKALEVDIVVDEGIDGYLRILHRDVTVVDGYDGQCGGTEEAQKNETENPFKRLHDMRPVIIGIVVEGIVSENPGSGR